MTIHFSVLLKRNWDAEDLMANKVIMMHYFAWRIFYILQPFLVTISDYTEYGQ